MLTGGDLPLRKGHRDPDFNWVENDWEVTIGRLELSGREIFLGKRWLVWGYTRKYRKWGPWALPPVVFAGDDLITGCHRLTAANRAGLTWLPKLVIQLPK